VILYLDFLQKFFVYIFIFSFDIRISVSKIQCKRHIGLQCTKLYNSTRTCAAEIKARIRVLFKMIYIT